jgi:hypothetical protein
MAKKHHKFTHTTVEHHGDSSHTVTHHHEDGPHKDIKHAVADHDSMMDSMMQHTSAPNPGEEAAQPAPPAAAPGASAPGPAGPLGA